MRPDLADAALQRAERMGRPTRRAPVADEDRTARPRRPLYVCNRASAVSLTTSPFADQRNSAASGTSWRYEA
jgi:hypothetical protein